MVAEGLSERLRMHAAERYSAPDVQLAIHLVRAFGPERAHEELDRILDQFTVVELAALWGDFTFWLRPKQLPPPSWRSWGFLTSRGWGKSHAIASFITSEVMAGNEIRIGLAAQNEDKTYDAQVKPLLEVAPPWFRPEWSENAGELMWPNGVTARAFTPIEPGAIRSENLSLAWLSELQSWPATTREEAWSNFVFATRVGRARTVFDATPKRGHPILKRLLARAAADPERHHLVRGVIYENPHLSPDALADMEREYLGTAKGEEELLGKMLADAEGAIWRQEWIDKHRRHMPTRFDYRVIGVDPATTSRKGSDTTGIVDVGFADGRAFVATDKSGKLHVSTWGSTVLDLYESGECDLIVAETNKGGDLVAQNLRVLGRERGLVVVVVEKDDRPRRLPGTVFVKEVHARGAKAERAEPVATAYEAGRVSHIIGRDLTSLEETLTTWEPSPNADSPGDLDALVHAVAEGLDLRKNEADAATGFRGLGDFAQELAGAAAPNAVAAWLSGSGRGERL